MAKKATKTKKKATKASKSSARGSSKASSHKAKTSALPTKFLTCPTTGEKVFVSTATLADIQRPPTSQKRKILFKVPSQKTRAQLYDELALCIEDRESRLLPKYGSRPWQVVCRVFDSNSRNGGSPFFRWFRGKLELAALPHLLEKIPEPPKFPGYIQTEHGVVVRHIVNHKTSSSSSRKRRKSSNVDSDDDSDDTDDDNDDDDHDEPHGYENLSEEELQRLESLQGRDISTLSQVAWDHRNDARHGAPLPTISIKWTCPLRQTFTSRKAAWDHALELAKAEQFVDRFLKGRGKTGAPLKPFRPTRAQTLQAGKVRFLRDGLWVVGQEQNWQNDRYLALERERQKEEERQHQKEEEAVSCAKQQQDGEPRTAAPVRKRRKITGSQLFLAVHRLAYREKRLKEIKKDMEEKRTDTNKDENEKTADTDEDCNTEQNPKVSKVSKTAAKVGMPTEVTKPKANRGKKSNNNNKVSFTLTHAERELRTIWKNDLSEKDRQSWDVKAETSFQRKLDMDDQARWDLEQDDNSDSDSDSQSEDSDSGEEAKEEIDDGEGEVHKSNPDHEESEQTHSVKLATDEQRSIWEIMSQAEQDFWKSLAWRKMLGGKKAIESTSTTTLSFFAYQHRVYDAFLGTTPEEYEVDATRHLRAAEKRKFLKELRIQRELIEQGMKQLTPPAQTILQKKIERWITAGLQSAKRREQAQAKKAAASALDTELLPSRDDIKSKQSVVEFVEYATRPPSSSFKADPPGAKLDDEPELKALPTPSQETLEPTAINAPANSNSQFTAVAATSTPISPSPPLVGQCLMPPATQGLPITTSAPRQSIVACNMACNHENDNAKHSPQPATQGLPTTTSAPHQSIVACNIERNHDNDNAKHSPQPATQGLLITTSAPHQSVVACNIERNQENGNAKHSPNEQKQDVSVEAVPKEAVQDVEESSESEEEEEEEAKLPFFTPTDHYCLNEEQIKLCMDASMEHFDAVMRTVKAKDLTRELADGFDLLRERGRGRYDMEISVFETEKFSFLNDINKAPWMPIVRQVLGDDVVIIHLGCFLSLPGSKAQNYHQDGPHLHTTSQRPCHAVNVFTPLVDMTLQHGPTEFCLGSHILGQEDWDRRYIETPVCKKGVPVMFDYRLGHRGLANTSKDPRPIVYCTYARAGDGKEFRDSVNFSRRRYRKLGELVDKPLSREERSQKRRAQLESLYEES